MNYNKKIKILQFPIANSFGGITHYALNNWKWMDKDRFQCDFATMSKKLDFADEILAMGSKIHYISCYAEEDEKQFRKDVGQILSDGYDVVHLHTKQWKSFIMEELCIEYGVPKIIVHSHSTGIDTLDTQKRLYETKEHERVKREFHERLATDFWACSNAAADFLFGDQIPYEKIKIMKNAIELEKYSFCQKTRERIREEMGLNGKIVVGCVGRLVYQKNHEFLIDVFARVAQKVEDAVLLLIGDGELKAFLKDKAEHSEISDKVLFLGKKDEVWNWYQAMDIFCMPSRFEGLGISFIEAQAAGLPCIGSNNIPEDVKIGNQVELLPFNQEMWSEKIIEFAGVGRMDNVQKLQMAGYDIVSAVKRIEQEYSEGLDNETGERKKMKIWKK